MGGTLQYQVKTLLLVLSVENDSESTAIRQLLEQGATVLPLSSQAQGVLELQRVPHLDPFRYARNCSWDSVHRELYGALSSVASRLEEPEDRAFLDIWSHLLISQSCAATLRLRLVEQALRAERPESLLLKCNSEDQEMRTELLALLSGLESAGRSVEAIILQ